MNVIRDIFFIVLSYLSLSDIMDLSKIVTTSISKIPPDLPLPKGGIPLFDKEAPAGRQGGDLTVSIWVILVLIVVIKDFCNLQKSYGSIFLTRTSLGLTPSEGPTTPSASIFSTIRAARL